MLCKIPFSPSWVSVNFSFAQILLHWASFFTSVGGVVFLLLARGHYSIDVIVAYYVTTRLWWIYHTLAHNQQLNAKGNHNMLDNLCWWHVFR